jgi:hypothetical protein
VPYCVQRAARWTWYATDESGVQARLHAFLRSTRARRGRIV